jgi:transposase-like protein
MELSPSSLMRAEVYAICGAGYRERTSERAMSRNCYRKRRGTRASERSRWRSGSSGTAATSQTGCSSYAAVQISELAKEFDGVVKSFRERR